MRKRVQIALAVLFVAILGVIAWQILLEREPVYQGKRLAFWLRAFDVSDNEPDKPNFNEAVEAVRDAGTNAFPILLHLLRASDSDLKHRLTRLAKKQHLIRIYYVPADSQQWAARQGFGALGKVTEYAVPALLEIYHQDMARGETNSNRPGYITEMLQILREQNKDASIPSKGLPGQPSANAGGK